MVPRTRCSSCLPTLPRRRRRLPRPRRRRQGPGGLGFLGRTPPCIRLWEVEKGQVYGQHMGSRRYSAADVLLWKDKKTSAVVIGGATVIWVMFEVLDYHLLTLISHVLIGILAILFLWSKATAFIKKSPPDIPLVQVPEDLAVNVARALRNDINRALHLFREIAMGHDLKKFLGVIVGLWILSGVGSCCDFLTLIYIAVLMLHMVPILYDKYQDKVDHFAGRAHSEARKQYEVLDAKVLSKIPRGLAKPKKQN
ncbi:reticulon-like protein B2 isoform X2 [Phragmites australis]|uniref:reticulon-like protein B2 isoform X2 n=1 Tax=Phragmites australis TaxID=29695 RepID=UPI002D78937D|nr:reticulon-like protein B2 isoform X2 [Phragmites australis]